MFGKFEYNENGLWCSACGELLATNDEVEAEDFIEPDQCATCGWPEEYDPVAAGFVDEDER
ncbi:MAG: hypothetical protein ACR2OV_17930 [Hyphomicrobiaceae bacterium]